MTMESRETTKTAAAAIPALDAKTRAVLAEFRPVLAAHLDGIVAEFLAYATAWPEMRAMAGSPQAMQCFREAQGRHLMNLFSGAFDEGYFARVSRMGQAHERAGLEPRWYLGAYGHALKQLVELAVETCGHDVTRLLALVSAINRVVELDMACAVATLDAAPHPALAEKAPSLGAGIPGLVEAATRPKKRAKRPA
jgi:hypothetical protein